MVHSNSLRSVLVGMGCERKNKKSLHSLIRHSPTINRTNQSNLKNKLRSKDPNNINYLCTE